MEVQPVDPLHEEKRRHVRLTLTGGEVQLAPGHTGRLVNASINGIAFEMPPGFPLKEGDELEITLCYRGQDILGRAIIRHITRGLVGCEWLEFKDDGQRRAYYSWLMFGPEDQGGG